MTDLCLPNFFVIGAGRSGTTFIYQALCEHPQVYSPGFKETFYFNRLFHKGKDWYGSLYHDADAARHKAIGDFTMEYYLFPETAKRIRSLIPNPKIICTLREPVERVFDHYYWDQLTFDIYSYKDYRKGLSFTEFAKNGRVFRFGDYYNCLRPFYEEIDSRDILILFLDELRTDPKSYLDRIFSFLEIDRTFSPSCSGEKVNKLRHPRLPSLAALGYKILEGLKGRGDKKGLDYVSSLRDNRLFNKIMFRDVDKDYRLLTEALDELWPLYHALDQQLATMIRSDLPRSWAMASITETYGKN